MDQNILFSPSGNTRLRLGSGALPGRNIKRNKTSFLKTVIFNHQTNCYYK